MADLEYIRIGDDQYFRGDATLARPASDRWVKLTSRDVPPIGGFSELRLHLTNPRTVGHSFEEIQTTLWYNFRRVLMRPTGLKTYSGHTCQEWAYDWLAKDLPMHDTICIGTTDRLPYHLTVGGGWGEAAYEWNPEISITAPR